jgi:hypothetical protein
MVKVTGSPGHPLNVGVTEIVPEIGAVPVLVPVNEGRLPVPFAGSPIEGLVLVQANVAPEGVLVKAGAVITVPAH